MALDCENKKDLGENAFEAMESRGMAATNNLDCSIDIEVKSQIKMLN